MLERISHYDGSLKFNEKVDDEIVADYQHKFIASYYKKHIQDKLIFDGGCWTGPLEMEIIGQNLNARIVGFDENPAALRVAQKNLPEVTFFCGNLLSPPDVLNKKYRSCFDTVFFMDVIEHLPRFSETRVVQYLSGLLKPRGVLILSTMANHPFNFIDPAWFLGHRHYSLKELERILIECGFTLIDAQRIGNLFWDIDLLYFYFFKHVLNKPYRRSPTMLKKINAGFAGPILATRFYLAAQKND